MIIDIPYDECRIIDGDLWLWDHDRNNWYKPKDVRNWRVTSNNVEVEFSFSPVAAVKKPTPVDLHREAKQRVGSGKAATAPCGHPGEHVFANYVRCLRGCDGEAADPKHVRPDTTKKICLHPGTMVMYSGRYRSNVKICTTCNELLEVLKP